MSQYAIFADSHDNWYNVRSALAILEERRITHGLHLGDIGSPRCAQLLMDATTVEWVAIWGNNDGERVGIVQRAAAASNFTIGREEFAEYDAEGTPVFLAHYPLIGRLAAESGRYRAAFYAHDHVKHLETLPNGTLLANPGGLSEEPPSFGIWNSATNEFEHVELSDARVAK